MVRPKDGADVELDEVVITWCPERVGVGDEARVGVLALVGVLGRDEVTEVYPPVRRVLGDLPLPVLRPPASMYW